MPKRQPASTVMPTEADAALRSSSVRSTRAAGARDRDRDEGLGRTSASSVERRARLETYASLAVGVILSLSLVCLVVAAVLGQEAEPAGGEARKGSSGESRVQADAAQGPVSRDEDGADDLARVRRLVENGRSAEAIRLLDEFRDESARASASRVDHTKASSPPAGPAPKLTVADIVGPHIRARDAKDALERYAPEPSAARSLEEVESLWKRAEAAVAAEDWAGALAAYEEFTKECAAVESPMKNLLETRAKASETRKGVEELARHLVGHRRSRTQAARHGALAKAWEAGEALMRQARALEEAADPAGAVECYLRAKERFAALEKVLAPFRKCRWAATQARRARSFSLRLSCHAASDHWLAEKAYDAAVKLDLDGRFDEAAGAYGKARAAFETHLETALKQSPAGLRVLGGIVKAAGPEELRYVSDGVLRKMLNDLPPDAAGHVLAAQERGRAVVVLKAMASERRAQVFLTLPVGMQDELIHDLALGLPRSEAEYLAERLPKGRPPADLSYLLDLVTERKACFGDLPNGARSVAFSPDSRILAVGHGPSRGGEGVRSCTVSLWDVRTGERKRNLVVGRDGYIDRIAYSPDGRHLATLCLYALYRSDGYSVTGRGLQLWALEKGEVAVWGVEKQVAAGIPKEGIPSCMTFSPDGRLLAVGTSGGAIALWDVERREAARILEGHTLAVTGLAFYPDGSCLASAGDDEAIALWDPAKGERLMVLGGRRVRGGFLVVSPSGRYLAGQSAEPGFSTGNVVSLWDARTGEEAERLAGGKAPQPALCGPAAFSPDGRFLFVCDDRDSIYAYDVAGGELVSTMRDEGSSGVESMAFSPDGRYFATGYRRGRNVHVRVLPEDLRPQDLP